MQVYTGYKREWEGKTTIMSGVIPESQVQGYLAQKKQRPPRTLPYMPRALWWS